MANLCISILIWTIFTYVNAQSDIMLHRYKSKTNTIMVPNDLETLLEVPCRSKVQAIVICEQTMECRGINFFRNGHCQMLTNLLDGNLNQTVTPVSFICK